MKHFTINKVGYTSGIYGCSGEYFNCLIVTGDNMQGFTFNGMYGAEQRIAGKLKELGYTEKHTNMNTYGKLTRKDIMRTESEYRTLENIDELIRHGYIEEK